MTSKLILGTASFGQPYGIKGDPVPSENEIFKICELAFKKGIKKYDINPNYNIKFDIKLNYEVDELSQILKLTEENWKKEKDEWEDEDLDPDECWWPFVGYAVLGYMGNDIWFINELIENREKSGASVADYRVGTTIYTEKDLERSLEFPIEIIQIPINLLDNRFLKYLPELKNRKIEIHARSVFLQGLLLMEIFPDWLPRDIAIKIKEFHRICKILNMRPYEAALGWVLGLKDVDYVIVGVNSAEQLAQLLEVKPHQWDYDFSIQDENVLDPRRWPTLDNQLKRSVETSTAIEGVNIKL